MEIVNCNPENMKACACLLMQVYSEPEYGEWWNEKNAFDYLNRFYKIEPLGCFVAIENMEVVGAIFSYSYPWQSETLIYIQELFVASKQRQKGIAKFLLKSIGKGSDTKAWLIANENTSASEFYKIIGFKNEGPNKLYYGIIST